MITEVPDENSSPGATREETVKLRTALTFSFKFVSFRSPYLFYLLTAGVDVVYFHLITLRHTPQSVGLLWTRDRPVAETST
jgi:hypothetical protein